VGVGSGSTDGGVVVGLGAQALTKSRAANVTAIKQRFQCSLFIFSPIETS